MSGLPASMRYVAARAAGGPEVLELDTMALPVPREDEVLIEVQFGGEGFSNEAYQQLLGAIEGMEYSPGRGR